MLYEKNYLYIYCGDSIIKKNVGLSLLKFHSVFIQFLTSSAKRCDSFVELNNSSCAPLSGITVQELETVPMLALLSFMRRQIKLFYTYAHCNEKSL